MQSHPLRCLRRLLAGGLLALALVAGVALLGAQEPAGKRRPVPDTAAQAAALKLVNEIFGEDIAKAKDPAAQSRLAAQLLGQARDSRKDDLAAAFVLSREARELAAAAGDHALAFQAIDLKAEVLTAAGKALTDAEANKGLVDVALRLIGEAVDADNYPAAARFGEVAEVAAKRAKVLALVRAVQKRNEEVAVVQKGFARLQPYIDRLRADPKDGEANLRLGEYYALLKGKWEKALPLLVRGSDAALKAQAAKDLAGPKDGKGQLAAGDGWWDLASQHKDPAQANLLKRAGHWYEQAALGLTGLSRTKALKRLDKVAALTQTPVVAKAGPVGAVRALEGHTNEVRGVAFSPDGRYALSGSKDETMRLWDLATGKEARVFRGHTKEVWAVAYHPNGRQVFSASWDATVKLWDANTGKEVRTFNHPKDVNSVVVSRDGRWMLTGSDDTNLRLWDLTTNQEVRRYPGHTDFVYGVAFSPDGQQVASGSTDKTVWVYETATGKKVREISGQTAPTNNVAFSHDGRHVFSCGDSAAHVWDVATGKEVRKFEVAGSSGYVLALALSPDGRRLLTGHEDRMVRLWDVATGKAVQRFEGHTGPVNCVAFSADGGRGISGGADNTVRIWGLPVR